ncbi:MAG: response regulator [Bacillota bacterium]
MTIKVMIVDDTRETRENVKRLLSLDQEIRVVAEASDGKDAIKLIKAKQPDVVLMDINMPHLNGLEATEQISILFPDVCVIMMTVQAEMEYMKRAMRAGAKDYIIKPFTEEELVQTIKKVWRHEHRKKNKNLIDHAVSRPDPKIITVFSTKGGVGKTTLAVNLAISLQTLTSKKVVVLDLDVQFGDVSALLSLMPQQTISHLVQEKGELDFELIESYLIKHSGSGIDVLAAPLRPEYAELITAEHVEGILKTLKYSYDYIVIDTASSFSEINLTALEMSQIVYLVLNLDLLSIKNTRLSLEVMDSLQLQEKTKLVLNKAVGDWGLKIEDIERILGLIIEYQIPNSERVVIDSINKGIPFMITNPTSKLAQAVETLSWSIIKRPKTSLEKKGLLKKIFKAEWGHTSI